MSALDERLRAHIDALAAPVSRTEVTRARTTRRSHERQEPRRLAAVAAVAVLLAGLAAIAIVANRSGDAPANQPDPSPQPIGQTTIPFSPADSGTSVGPSTIVTDRPPIPSDEVISVRFDQLPTSGLPELRGAVATSADWAGTLTGILYRRLPDGEWKLCFEILESYPESCGTHVDLSREPTIRSQAPDHFEVRNDVETGAPVMEISPYLTISGVFLYDSLVFVPDTTPESSPGS